MAKAKVQRGETEQELISRLKDEYVRFYGDLPVQKAAADFIGRDEDTIINWRKADPQFADDVKKAKSEWAKKNYRRVSPDGLLSRLYPDLKPAKQELDTTVTGNFTFNYVRPNNQLPTDAQARPGVALPDGSDDH